MIFGYESFKNFASEKIELCIFIFIKRKSNFKDNVKLLVKNIGTVNSKLFINCYKSSADWMSFEGSTDDVQVCFGYQFSIFKRRLLFIVMGGEYFFLHSDCFHLFPHVTLIFLKIQYTKRKKCEKFMN